ncbi:lipoate protein ligase C-terminal domain-containing protein, partial [Metabacillus fastidiosus]|uniref:lipoate protein ligase C-terminal domain-containing protein n=1 Tax=Metabacillus fastidiosus TaxID=1458 RepID=UPI002DBDF3EE
IKSFRCRVASISEFLKEEITIEQFRELLLHSIFEESEEVPKYTLTEEDWKKINELSNERYKNWDWNYGKSPKFNLQRSHRFPVGQIDVRLEVNKGLIEQCKIYGDFFGVEDVHEIEEKLTGIKYEKSAIEEEMKELDVKKYFGNIEMSDFVNLLY